MKRKVKLKHAGMANMSAACNASDRNHYNGYPILTRGAAAFSFEAWQSIRRGLKLSAREFQIMHGIFDNKLECAIAAELGISINTVRTELRRLRRKLSSANRVSLVLSVVEEFLRQTCSDKTTLPSICRDHASGRCPLLRAAAQPSPNNKHKRKPSASPPCLRLA
jgi:DNA-binding CsgD family transcriptional regulator